MKITTKKAVEIVGWKCRTLEGFEHMTAFMLLALRELKASKHAGYPFLTLNMFDPRTGKALVARDWAVASTGIDGSTKHKITGRGEMALEAYDSPLKRRDDGGCAKCGAERHVAESGYQYAYCIVCVREISKNRPRYGKNPGLCPACGERDKHITKNGTVRSYCKPCQKKKTKRYRKLRQKRLRWKKKIGLSMPCYRCKKRERHQYGNTVSDYCLDCTREVQREYRNRKIWEKYVG